MAVTAAIVATATGTDETTATRLLPVATAKITEYLRGGEAPEALRDEAALLFVGYLSQAESHGSGVLIETSVGPITTKAVTDHSAAFRRCGAAGLLASYRRRRGGAV